MACAPASSSSGARRRGNPVTLRQRFPIPISLKRGIHKMQISSETTNEALFLSIEGQINGNTATSLEACLRDHVDKAACRIALDFSGVDYISSAGMRVVLWLAKTLQDRGGALALYGLRQNVLEIFDMCGFVDILTIVETREAALEKIRPA
jgi:stage II sporulation protein AA (anti-sigma F factor antagonist)